MNVPQLPRVIAGEGSFNPVKCSEIPDITISSRSYEIGHGRQQFPQSRHFGVGGGATGIETGDKRIILGVWVGIGLFTPLMK